MGNPRRIMVIGNGGRECALATALLTSADVEQLIITPANWGVVDPQGGKRVRVLSLKAEDVDGIVAAANAEGSELAVIGPEAPLVAGLADALREAGIPALGPGATAAKLEGSKEFAKDFMQRHGIPTANYQAFTSIDALMSYLAVYDSACVLKADGLAAGKGVIVCQSRSEAEVAAQRMLVKREFGEAGSRVVVEQLLTGPELSFTCLLAGGKAQLLGVSTDYKPLLDGQQGPNTGGMGNICPTPFATPEVLAEFKERILNPVMAGLNADGLDYRGFLFIGAMLTPEDGLKVLEFNVRLGDPEAQVVLPLLEADWPAVFGAAADGRLELDAVKVKPGSCVAIVLASANYPYGKSEPAVIEGFDRVQARGLLDSADPEVRLYFAGVGRAAGVNTDGDEPYTTYFSGQETQFLATGGRVLAVSARGEDLSSARRLAYEVVGNLRFEGMKFRSDIGKR